MNSNAFRLERVSVAYSGQGPITRVLDDISLAIFRGEWIAVVGKNGSGKSTLAKVIAKLSPLSEGVLVPGWIDDHKLTEQRQTTIRMVMQNPESQFIGETVEEDLLYTLELTDIPNVKREAIICDALDRVGLLHKRWHPVAALSGGQKQCLAVAGCIIAGAELIIFDEATSMLDPLARDRLLQAAKELHQQGITIIWISHALEELVYAQRVVALDEGHLVYDGDVGGFFYPDRQSRQQDESVCAQLGFMPPYAVQASLELIEQGISLGGRPLTCEELFELLEVKLSNG